MFQIITLVVLLGLTGRLLELERFLFAYAVSAVAVVVVSGLAPAIGPYVHLAPDPALMRMMAEAGVWHLTHCEALRAGTFTVFDFSRTEGLVTFPSFHTALAVLTVRYAWSMPRLRWPAFALNVCVVVGTLPEGGHYLVDLIGGGAAAWAAIAVANRVCVPRNTQRASQSGASRPLSTPARV